MKKVFYILNLLFLTLSVSGGSVFAAAPEQYIDADGSVEDVPSGIVDLENVTLDSTYNYPLTGQNWYYIDGPVTKNDHYLYVESGDNVNIVVVGESKLNLGSYAFFVPSNGSVSFWAAPDANGEDTSNLTITGSYSDFVIGNNTYSQNKFSYSSNDFGNITFNSGSYTVINGNSTASPAIGSKTTSGGTITVNQEAEVTAYNSADTGAVSVGVVDGQTCNIAVAGGSLTTMTSDAYRSINVGGGSLTVTGLGRVLAYSNAQIDVSELVNEGIWNVQSGVVGYYDSDAGTQSLWNAIVGGNITVPNPDEDVPPTDLLNLQVPGSGANGISGTAFWNSLTVLDSSALTLGTTKDSAVFNVSGSVTSNSYVDNYGTIDIVNLEQPNPVVLPVIWNNKPGSSLTISEGETLGVFSFNNGTLESSQQPSTVNLNGTLQISSGVVTDNVLNNYSQLNIGPIGTVSGGASPNLINYQKTATTPGGTVTSQNPCYYEFKCTPLLSTL